MKFWRRREESLDDEIRDYIVATQGFGDDVMERSARDATGNAVWSISEFGSQ